MDGFELLLLLLLLVCGIAACISKNLLVTAVIFTAYSLIMSVIWALLKAPDLAVTEAAVGAGVSGILLLVTLRKLRDLKREHEVEQASGDAAASEEGGTHEL